MSAVTPLPDAGITITVPPGVDSQPLLAALFAYGVTITAVTVTPDAPIYKALNAIGARVVAKHGRYEVVK